MLTIERTRGIYLKYHGILLVEFVLIYQQPSGKQLGVGETCRLYGLKQMYLQSRIFKQLKM